MFILFTEIPVFPTVTAKVAFEDFQWRTDFDTNFFKVPKDYREDASRWVLLLSYSHNKYLIIIMYIFWLFAYSVNSNGGNSNANKMDLTWSTYYGCHFFY